MSDKPFSVWYFFPYEQWSRDEYATLDEAIASLTALKGNIKSNRKMLQEGRIKVTQDIPIAWKSGAFQVVGGATPPASDGSGSGAAPTADAQ